MQLETSEGLVTINKNNYLTLNKQERTFFEIDSNCEVTRLHGNSKKTYIKRKLYSGIQACITSPMYDRSLRSYIIKEIDGVQTPLIHVATDEDNYYIIRGFGGKILYKCVFNNFDTPLIHDKTSLPQELIDECLAYYSKYSSLKPMSEKQQLNYAKLLDKILVDTVTKWSYNYLTQFYNTIVVKIKDIETARFYIKEVAKAHKEVVQFIDTEGLPKLQMLEIKNRVRSSIGFYHYQEKITILADDQYKDEVKKTYYHEYGHYLHHYKSKLSSNKETNDELYKSMVKTLRGMYSLSKLRGVYTEGTYTKNSDDSSKYTENLSSFGRYMYSESEIIARAYEYYLHYTVSGIIEETSDYRSFTLEEIAVIRKHIKELV